MREYARITGLPEMPRALDVRLSCSRIARSRGPDEILGVARTLREKKLPCDALIYLGTEFTPSGWNTRNGEFTWQTGELSRSEEDDRRAARRALQGRAARRHRRAAADRARSSDPCTRRPPCRADARRTISWPPDAQVACYWPMHKAALSTSASTAGGRIRATGSTGRRASTGIRMYWEGTQLWRPERAAVRAASQRLRRACSGTARSSGRATCYSTWETLKTHVPVAVNTGLSGYSVLGHRHRRLRADAGVHRRAATCAGSSSARSVRCSARTAATGICACRGAGTAASSGRTRPRRTSTAPASRTGAAQRAGRADLPEVSRAALSADAVPVHGGARAPRDRPADHARAVAALSRRSRRGRARRRVSCGAATCWSRRSSRRARRRAALPAARRLVRLLDERDARRRTRDRSRRSIWRRCRCTCAPAPCCRWDR